MREPGLDTKSFDAPLPFWRVLLEHRKWFVLFTLAALALRLVFYIRFPHVAGDSLIYGDIAKNWLDQGIFGLSHADGVRPTWIVPKSLRNSPQKRCAERNEPRF